MQFRPALSLISVAAVGIAAVAVISPSASAAPKPGKKCSGETNVSWEQTSSGLSYSVDMMGCKGHVIVTETLDGKERQILKRSARGVTKGAVVGTCGASLSLKVTNPFGESDAPDVMTVPMPEIPEIATKVVEATETSVTIQLTPGKFEKNGPRCSSKDIALSAILSDSEGSKDFAADSAGRIVFTGLTAGRTYPVTIFGEMRGAGIAQEMVITTKAPLS